MPHREHHRVYSARIGTVFMKRSTQLLHTGMQCSCERNKCNFVGLCAGWALGYPPCTPSLADTLSLSSSTCPDAIRDFVLEIMAPPGAALLRISQMASCLLHIHWEGHKVTFHCFNQFLQLLRENIDNFHWLLTHLFNPTTQSQSIWNIKRKVSKKFIPESTDNLASLTD